MLGELCRKLVEVVGELYLATQSAEGFADRTAAFDGDESRDGSPGALDDDLFAIVGEIDEPGQLRLRLMHSDAYHDQRIARLARTGPS